MLYEIQNRITTVEIFYWINYLTKSFRLRMLFRITGFLLKKIKTSEGNWEIPSSPGEGWELRAELARRELQDSIFANREK